MITLNTALDGMQSAETSFNRAASRILQPSDNLPNDVVDLTQSKTDFEANRNVDTVSDDLTKSTLDLLA